MLYLSSFDDVNNDREMGICEDHFELVSNSNTGDHVSDSATNGTKSGISLFLLKPHAKLKSFFARFLSFFFSDLERTMSE